MTSDGDYTWKFTPRVADQRDPDEFLEPLTGGPLSKLRVGQYRLGCILDRSESVLEVHRIEHRSGTYTADDDWQEPICNRYEVRGLNGFFETV